jgi:hypothetical protein
VSNLTPFSERAESMGLAVNEEAGLYQYSDRYGEIVYRQMVTKDGEWHETDGLILPALAIFTKPEGAENYIYCGRVSDIYKFVGNDVLNQRIRDSIQDVGMAIIQENSFQNICLTRLRNEIIIRSSQNIAEVGDVFPVMIVDNSYNGTKAATISFGISTLYAGDRIVFGFSLGEMRQVHIETSRTEMTSTISSYMEVFTENIADMISSSFQNRFTEDQMLSVMDIIEEFGKKRREKISAILTEMQEPVEEGLTPPLPSAWQIFLAIVRYSSIEPNLNVKRLLENAAESVLVIPPRMYEVLERLQSS